MNWDGKRVTLYTAHDVGGKLFLCAPNNRHPAFTLRSTGAPTTTPPAYILTFDDGYMHPCWRSCSALVEMGAVAPPTLDGLIPIVESNADKIQEKYEKALGALLADLQTPVLTADIDYRRIEGVMQVNPYGTPRLDRVRIVCIPQVVPVDRNASKDDLIVIALSFTDGLAENGGASGPPH
jgi:hypothetical protein